jgi:hypothetical protein
MLVLAATLQARVAASDAIVGKWSGTFAGDSAGTFSLTFTTDADKKLGGSIEVKSDAGDGYTTPLRVVTVDGASVKIAYDSPNGDPIDLTLDGTLEGKELKGTWAVIAKDTKEKVATGTFSSTKD